MTLKLDELDSKIIHLLKQDGRMPNTDIAKKLKISEATIRKRLRKLIGHDIIKVQDVGMSGIVMRILARYK